MSGCRKIQSPPRIFHPASALSLRLAISQPQTPLPAFIFTKAIYRDSAGMLLCLPNRGSWCLALQWAFIQTTNKSMLVHGSLSGDSGHWAVPAKASLLISTDEEISALFRCEPSTNQTLSLTDSHSHTYLNNSICTSITHFV